MPKASLDADQETLIEVGESAAALTFVGTEGGVVSEGMPALPLASYAWTE